MGARPRRRLQGGRRVRAHDHPQAADIPGMAMLDLAFAAPPGVRVYVDPPQTDDHVERGDLTGRRIDRVTYVFERGGSFPMPPSPAVVGPCGRSPEECGGCGCDHHSGRGSGKRARRRAHHAVTRQNPHPRGCGGASGACDPWCPDAAPAETQGILDAEAEAFDALRRASRTAGPAGIYRAFSRWQRALDPMQREAAAAAAGPTRSSLVRLRRELGCQ